MRRRRWPAIVRAAASAAVVAALSPGGRPLAAGADGVIKGSVDIRRSQPTTEARPASAGLGAAPRRPVEFRPAVVYLDTAPGGAFELPEPGRAAMDQRDQAFVPHVLAITVGTTVDFPNSDLTFHNVFSLSRTRTFDLGRYSRGRSKSVRFDRPGVVQVFCDIHSHMSAYILVFAHRYFAVTDKGGAFAISGIPPGSYTLAVWHEGEVRDTRAMGAGHLLQATLDAAIGARATRETDVELVASLYGVIGKRAIATGGEACRAGLSGHPVRARAAAECLRALGEAVPAPPIGAAEPPPGIDVAQVIGKQLHWRLVTSRGEIVIELRPDVAPWAVATIVTLTARGYYDGLEFHRVVPNFVVQGGDPTMSGWGGPGFTIPAEPASLLEGPGFMAGGVGIADAGRDSGGSQWFIMHARAPHLDGRYTWFGSVISGQKSADALLIGDRVEKATIEEK